MKPLKESLNRLRSLDRRLLAVEGDLQTRLELEMQFHLAGNAKGVRIPDEAELSRLEIELDAVRAELADMAQSRALTLAPDFVVTVSRVDAEAAYDALERRTRQLRTGVREAFATLRSQQPALEREPDLADDSPYVGPVPGALRRRLARWGPAFIIGPLIASLVYWAHSHTRSEVIEVARTLCAAKPACDGDVMEIAYAQGHKLRRTRHNPGLVLFRRSADCSRTVEVYFHTSGKFIFRGSFDDPDAARRDEFSRKRGQWYEEREITTRTSCLDVDSLDP